LQHVMFDIDGTLVESYEIDSECFIAAVNEVIGIEPDPNWSAYKHVTDTGILNEILASHKLSSEPVIHDRVKNIFVEKLRLSLKSQPIREVPGAADFLQHLKAKDNVYVSLATGGWYESAVLKLESAGISPDGIPIVSSNDHYSRTEIMKLALSSSNTAASNCIYFGDASWDKKACEQLGFRFVLVGNRLKHTPKIKNFEPIEEAMAIIGL
jgi:beta-phosphoglucomutase-like phosphatase (HAD superfamily)